MPVSQYLFVFETPWHALKFVEKLQFALPGVVVTYRDGEAVYVVSSAGGEAHERIMALSRTSSSTTFRAIR